MMVMTTNDCKQELARRKEAEEEAVPGGNEDGGRGGPPRQGLRFEDLTTARTTTAATAMAVEMGNFVDGSNQAWQQ